MLCRLLFKLRHSDIIHVQITDVIITRHMIVIKITQLNFTNDFVVAIAQIFEAARNYIVTLNFITVMNRITTVVTNFIDCKIKISFDFYKLFFTSIFFL